MTDVQAASVAGPLAAMRRALETLHEDAKANPLHYWQPLPHQAEWLESTAREKLLRTGNQLGKTTAAAKGVIEACLEKPGAEWWVICSSFSQSVAVQSKFWELMPAARVITQPFEPKNGFGAKGPMVMFDNGSIIRFKTANQDTKDLASATISGALFDEPPSDERIYTEIQKRVQEQRGPVWLSMTPINAPCEWLRARCETEGPDGRPLVHDVHYEFVPSTFIPVVDEDERQTMPDGRRIPFHVPRPLTLGDGTPKDQAWIDDVTARTIELERDVTLHGHWEERALGAIFRAFVPRWQEPYGRVGVVGGIDHGSGRNFSQVALFGYIGGVVGNETVWIRAEYASEHTTTHDDDAAGILEALEGAGLAWTDLDKVHGDKVHHGGRGGRDRKSNEELHAAIARAIPGVRSKSLTPRITSAKIGTGQRGRVNQDVQWFHKAMVEGRLFVHPSCVRLIESLQKWGGEARTDDRKRNAKQLAESDWKHALDAMRYLCRDITRPRPRRIVGGVRLG